MSHCENVLDEWLTEQGLSGQSYAAGLKRELTLELRTRMEAECISVKSLAERMQTSRADTERLLDPENDLTTLRALHRAARALNGHLRVYLT